LDICAVHQRGMLFSVMESIGECNVSSE